MFLKIFKDDVIEGLQKGANIIPSKTGAAYLRTIWLKAGADGLEILSTDSSLEFRGTYSAEVIEPGLAGVQGKAFVDLLRRLPEGQISLKLDSQAPILHIEQGRRKYKLPTNEASWFQNFSDFPESGAVVWAGDFFQDLIEKIIYCIGDEGMDALACLVIKPVGDGKIEVAGMNGHQFAMVSFINEDLGTLLPPEGILIQKKYLAELKKWLGADEIDLNISEKRFFVRTGNKKESLSMPLSFYQYPDYKTFLSRLEDESASRLTLSRGEVQAALNRIAIFNSDSNRCTYFDLSSSEINMSAQGQDVGTADETMDVEFEGNLKKIAFPTSNLLSIFDHYSSEKIEMVFTGSEGPCGITGSGDSGYLVIIMPMKITDDKFYSEEQV